MTLKKIGKLAKRPYDFRQMSYDPIVKEFLKQFYPEELEMIRHRQRHGGSKDLLIERLMQYDAKPIDFKTFSNTDKALYKRAHSIVKKQAKLPHPEYRLDWDDCLPHLEMTKSSGYPHYRRKGDILPTIREDARCLSHFAKTREFYDVIWPPCSLFKRSHVSDRDEPKVRLIWGYPAAMTVIELGWVVPLLERYKQTDLFSFSGRFSDRVQDTINTADPLLDICFNLDWSSFDTTAEPWEIRMAFDCFKQNINWNDWHGRALHQQERSRWQQLWKNMVEYFINTPILDVNGDLHRKDCGIPSGSGWTGMVGGIINRTRILFLLMKAFGSESFVTELKIYVLGDDSWFKMRKSLLALNPNWLQAASEWCLQHTRWKLSVVKCQIGKPNEVKFLGFKIALGSLYRTEAEWAELVYYPESNDVGLNWSLARAIGCYVVAGGSSFLLARLCYWLIGRGAKMGKETMPRNIDRLATYVVGLPSSVWFIPQILTPPRAVAL